ncbi:MAG: SpoIIE family protein phosphatase [Oscillospiraceae bacterium]|nr:SpoIIE family protein phosphatase [Oscillospiraceae bacterium]
MGAFIDMAWQSLNKYGEELCGDMVQILHIENSDIAILADGMGSGVKANILATLTTKILGTMLLEGMSIDECVQTIAKTLPICKVRDIAYATFSILQIFKDGSAYLVEYDNPKCLFIRDGKVVDYSCEEREIEGKNIREYHFNVEIGDCFVLMSDGVIWAGAGPIMNYGWTWDSVADYTLRHVAETKSAVRLTSLISEACRDLYIGRPGDDTTVSVVTVRKSKILSIFTGPPKNPGDDEKIMRDFMDSEGKKVIAGGTTAQIASRVLGKKINMTVTHLEGDVPPESSIEGIDLVTEGIVTLGKALDLLERFDRQDFDGSFFEELDADNGAAKLAKLIIEESTELRFFVGTALNEAHTFEGMDFTLSLRSNLIQRLIDVAKRIGRRVSAEYF